MSSSTSQSPAASTEPAAPPAFRSPKAPLTSLHYPDSELVFGVVSAVGTDLDHFQELLKDHLKPFGYSLTTTKLSAFLDEIPAGGLSTKLDNSTEYLRIKTRMKAGNEVRQRYQRGDVLGLYGVSEIYRARPGADLAAPEDASNQAKPIPSAIHFLRSLKHPDEVHALRRIYGPGFFLIALYSHEEERQEYLTVRKNMQPAEAKDLIALDEDDKEPLGQRTRDTFQLADVFIRSTPSNGAEKELRRFLDLLFGNPHVTPTEDEHAMFLAYAASLRSADLSRQVGAVVVSKNGETIATGANDVPKAGGGLYWPGSNDQRDYIKGYDSNARNIEEIARETLKLLGIEQNLGTGADIYQRLKDSRLYDLTEFGRAVHAEMEALLCCAREGVSPRGGILYTTTFPCHNCAKHIVAAGISKVVYVEPYPKSKAYELHDDSIEFEPSKKSSDTPKKPDKVRFSPFVGIAARRYFDLFSMRLSPGGAVLRKHKRTGEAIRWKPAGASPRVFMAPASYLHRELLAIRELFGIGIFEGSEP